MTKPQLSVALLIALAGCLAALAEPDASHDRAREEWMVAHQKREEAEKAERYRQYARAFELFTQAKMLYHQVLTRYPKWNASIVQYRLDACEKKLRALERRAEVTPKEKLEPYESKADRELRARLRTLQTRLAAQETDILQLNQALERARAEAARNGEAGRRLPELLQENQRLRDSDGVLRRRIEELSAEVLKIKSRAGIEDALLTLRQEQQHHAIKRAEFEQAKAKLELQVSDLRRKASQAALEREQARQQLADLERRSQPLRGQLADLNAAHQAEVAAHQAEKQQAARAAARVKAMEADLADLNKLLAINTARAREAETENRGLRDQLADLRNRLAKTGDNVQHSAAEAAWQQRLQAARDQHTASIEQLAAAREAADAQQRENRELRRALDQTQAAAAAAGNSAAEAARKLDTLQQANQRLRDRIADDERRYETERKAYQAAQVALLERTQERDRLAATEADLRNKYEAQVALNRALQQRKPEPAPAPNLPPPPPPRSDETMQAYRETIDQLNTRVRELKDTLARRQVALLNERTALKEARRQLAEAKPASPSDDVKVLKDHILKLVNDLETERERTARLRTRLTALPGAPPTPATAKAPADAPDADREARITMLLHKATTEEQAGNRQAAIYHYQRVLELHPHRQLALVRMGTLLTDSGDFANAERYLMRAFYNNPDALEVLTPLGFLLVHTGKSEMALSMLSRAVALYPDNPDFHRYLGVACRTIGWSQAAEVQFVRSHELDPGNAETAFNLAIVCAAHTPPRMADARRWYRQARELGAQADPGLEELLRTDQDP